MTTWPLDCPRCGSSLDGLKTEVTVDLSEEAIRTPFDCPQCDAPLVHVLEKETLAAYIEDRRDD